MPHWLAIVCAAAVFVAGAYLFYVILRPERF